MPVRRIVSCLLLVTALSSPAAADGDDLATATIPAVAVNVGDWARYAVQTKYSVTRTTERFEELWTVVEVSPAAVLFSVQREGTTEWLSLPHDQSAIPAFWVVLFARGRDVLGRSGERPRTLTPPTRAWTPRAVEAGMTNEEVANVTPRKVKLDERTKGKDREESFELQIDLDPTVPVMGVKRATVSSEHVFGRGRNTTERTVRLLSHGVAAGAPAPPAAPERPDIAHLRRASLHANPFADLVVGATSTFKVVLNSSRPIGGKSTSEGRIQVTVAARTDESATLRFHVLEGVGTVTGAEDYERTVPVGDAAAREPHRYIDALMPMVGGALGGGARCRSGSRRETSAKVAGAMLPAEAIVLTFENDTRYEATFARGSPVGFVATEQRFSNGIPQSWDEVKLSLED